MPSLSALSSSWRLAPLPIEASAEDPVTSITPVAPPVPTVFRNLGDQLLSVVRSCASGRSPDPRLFEVERRAQSALSLSVRAAPFAGSAEQVPSEGGFLIEPTFARQIVRRMYLTGRILSRCFTLPITTNGVRFPQFSETTRVAGSRLGGVQCFYENEAQSLIATKPAFELSTLTAKKITGVIKVTDELSLDSDALNSWVEYALTQEAVFKLEGGIMAGTGAGMPLGVISAPATVVVAEENGQSAGTVVNTNVQKMLNALWAPSWENAAWYFNQDLLPKLTGLTTVVGAAGSQSNAWQFSIAEGQPNRLMGIPAYPSEHCQAPGTQGDLVLADWSRYVVGMRSQQTDVSIHVLFESDQSIFRFVMRVDGQPIDQFPVTPVHGSVATSPFVVLGART